MPIKNGKLYIDETTDPKEGIDVREIARCIGVGSLDLGKLCAHDKVNMWSRKKHIANGKITIDYKNDWWKSPDGSCSIEPPRRVSTFQALLGQYDGRNNGWTRMSSIRARALDFNGYYHYAKPPIGGIEYQTVYFNDADPINVSVYYNDDDVDETGSGSIKMTDMRVDNMELSDWYIGLALFDEEGTLCKGHSATQTGGNIESVEFPKNELIVSKSYMLVPFFSNKRLQFFPGDVTEGGIQLMSVPIVQPVKFKYLDVSTLLVINIEASWSEDKSSITFTVTIINNGTTDRNLTNPDNNGGTVRLVRKREGLETRDQYWALNLEEGDFDIDLGLTSVPKNGISVTKTQVIPEKKGEIDFRSSDYVILARLSSMNRNFDGGPEEVPNSNSVPS